MSEQSERDQDTERLKDLTLKLYRDIYGFLGAKQEEIVLSDYEGWGHSIDTTASLTDRSIAMNALGNVLAAMIVTFDNPQETFDTFGANLCKTCSSFMQSMGKGQTLQ